MYKLSVGSDCAKQVVASKEKTADMRIDFNAVPI
jgi:hypothetical protein